MSNKPRADVGDAGQNVPAEGGTNCSSLVPIHEPDDDTRRAAKARFLVSLKECGSVGHAAAEAGIGRRTAYRWRLLDPQFGEDWDDCLEDASDALEASIYQRGLAGDNAASFFWLKGQRPWKHRESYQLPSDLRDEFERLFKSLGEEAFIRAVATLEEEQKALSAGNGADVDAEVLDSQSEELPVPVKAKEPDGE